MKNKYYDDFRCCELKTKVKQTIEEKGFYWHIFEDTIFFVDGKQNDSGYVNQCEVLKLKEVDGVVYHLLSEKLEGEVLLVVNHARRYMNAQNETLSLLMDEVMQSVYHIHAGEHRIHDFVMVSRYSGKCLTPQQKNELQVSLNGMIRDNLPVRITYERISDERYVNIGLFNPIKNKNIQVPSLNFIQMVNILEIVEKEDEFMIITTCGDQMLYMIDKYYEIVKESCEALQCEPLFMNTSIHHLLNKLKSN